LSSARVHGLAAPSGRLSVSVSDAVSEGRAGPDRRAPPPAAAA
jgi:hypothetical protein